MATRQKAAEVGDRGIIVRQLLEEGQRLAALGFGLSGLPTCSSRAAK